MMRKILKNEWILKIGSAVISLGAFCILWQLVVTFTSMGDFLPGPVETFAEFFRRFVKPYGKVTLPLHIWSSLQRILIGYAVASAAAIALGIVMGTYRAADAIVMPLFNILRPIPPVAWIPLAILWFGIGDASKYFLVFLATFLSVLQNAYAGARSADPVLVGAARMLGANDRFIFRTITIPCAVPYIFSGLQNGLTAAWGQVIASEMIRSSAGVGWIIIRGMDNNDILQELVGILTIGIIGFILAASMRGVESKLCRWTTRGK